MSDDTGCVPEGVNRFEWERRFRSSDIPATTKLLGWTLSTYANRDGTNMHPGVQRLMADTGILSDKTVRKHLAALVTLGWIERTFHGSSAGRQALADVYRLTAPIAAARAWSREDHRYCDPATPGNGSLTPVAQTTAHHVSTHQEVSHHSARLALAHDKSRADTEQQAEDLREDITERLEAWATINFDAGLDPEDHRLIEKLVDEGRHPRMIENMVKKRIMEFESVWPSPETVERDWAASADCPF